MRKLLFTAAVTFASNIAPAHAQGIALYGDARLGIGYNIDNDGGVLTERNEAGDEVFPDDPRAISRVRFGVNMTGETGSGITFGADIRAAVDSDDRYVLIARPVSAEIGSELKRLKEEGEFNLGGVDLTPIPHRTYPGGPLAAQVLGFVAYNHDGQQVGYFGVEGFYNDLLAGRAVRGIERVVPFEAGG